MDRMVLRRLLDQVDAVVTVVIIFVVVVLTVMASVFIAIQVCIKIMCSLPILAYKIVFQIYGESVQLLQLGTSLVNQTISHPEARQWLPQGIDQMVNISMVVDNAYAYGKSGIATLVTCPFCSFFFLLAPSLPVTLLETDDGVGCCNMYNVSFR